MKSLMTSKLYQYVITAGITFIAWSCTGNNNKTDDTIVTGDNKMSDTTISNYNTRNAEPNNNEPNKMMSDSTINNNAAANNTSNTGGDADFMMKVAEINMEEITLGKLAQQKGTMAHVKKLGRMMVTEHTKAMANLNVLAKTKTVALPATESEKIKDAYNSLGGKTGKDFDKAYSDMMVKGHKEAIALFEKTNIDTKDTDVKAMTAGMIPTLKTHLKHAVMCQKECEKM
jgi:putative membrane protein